MASFCTRLLLSSGLLAIAVAAASAQDYSTPPISLPPAPVSEWQPTHAVPETPIVLTTAVSEPSYETPRPQANLPPFRAGSVSDGPLLPAQTVSDPIGTQPAPVQTVIQTDTRTAPLPSERIAVPASGQPAPASCASYGEPPTFWQRCKSRWQACFLGYPSEFESPPLGQSVNAHIKVQVENGDAARMVLYEYDFVRGTANLNQRGKDQLAKIAELLPRNFHYVIIERTPANPQLAESRRVTVLNDLAQKPFPVPQERVVVGAPIASGISGAEAELVYQNIMEQIKSGPQGVSAGGASAGQSQPQASTSGQPTSR